MTGMISQARMAVAIVIDTVSGERFFRGFSKHHGVRTAWSLAGATLLQAHQVTYHVEKLIKQGRKVRVCDVVMVDQ